MCSGEQHTDSTRAVNVIALQSLAASIFITTFYIVHYYVCIECAAWNIDNSYNLTSPLLTSPIHAGTLLYSQCYAAFLMIISLIAPSAITISYDVHGVPCFP